MKNRFLTILIVGFSCIAFGQEQISPEKAFANKNYQRAIQGFENKLVIQPDNYDARFKLGLSYLNSFPNISKAIDCLKQLEESEENNFEHLFYLGRAYHLNYKFDEAILSYNSFAKKSTDTTFVKKAKRQVEMCNNAKVLVANPVNVTIKNLGDTVNSEADDFNAFIEQTESVLIFSSTRAKKNKAEEPTESGEYTSDIFMSYYETGAWQNIKSQSNVSTPVNEEVVGVSADGTLMFYNTDARGYKGDMIVSKRKKGSFSEPIWVEKTINTSAIEYTGCVTHNRQNFYYSSDREEGFGGFDIYWAKRLPDVNWAKPMLLGEGINTEYGELFPQLSPDEKTLYFSSEGHNSMGGYDLFKVEWDPIKRKWGPVQNLGYPINTPGDDMHISMNIDGSMGYISSYRKDSRGNLDIYSVKFNDVEAKKSVVLGKLLTYAPVDFNDYQEFNIYRHQGKNVKIPVEFNVQDPEMIFVKKQKDQLKSRFMIEALYLLNVDGKEKEFKYSELPENYQNYKLVDVVLKDVANPNYITPPPVTTFATKVVKQSFLDVYDSQNELVGTYSSNPNSGTFVLILEPGIYSVVYFADFYKEATSKIEVFGKAGFEPIINKDFQIEFDGDPSPIHYKEIKTEE